MKRPVAWSHAICLQRTVALVFCYRFENNFFRLRIIMAIPCLPLPFVLPRILSHSPQVYPYDRPTPGARRKIIFHVFIFNFLVSRKVDTMLADGYD